MRLIDKLSYSQNWNIGVCDLSPNILIRTHSLGKVRWMKHPYKDRWFADPFILRVTKTEIIVFVEECLIEHPKGILCELHINRKTMRLEQRFVLLETDTHLSYPIIFEQKGKIYVYPENGASGKLYLYEYNEQYHRLENPCCILDEAVADSTILENNGVFWLIATKFPETQEKAYIYSSDSLFGPFTQVIDKPVQVSRSCSRPGGYWFRAYNQLYRPAQNCVGRYGRNLSIMAVQNILPHYSESEQFSLLPVNRKYKKGIHTLNFKDSLCVIDGYGDLFPIWSNLIGLVRQVKHKVEKK